MTPRSNHVFNPPHRTPAFGAAARNVLSPIVGLTGHPSVHLVKRFGLTALAMVGAACIAPAGALAQGAQPGFGAARNAPTLEVELTSVSAEKNTVQIPNTSNGTRFSLRDVQGSGSTLSARTTLTYPLSNTQELRVLVAPLAIEDDGSLRAATRFQGGNFSAGPVDASYRFNSYRLTWRYTWIQDPDWTVKVGLTGKIRDARIALSQSGQTRSDSNVGFVPLLHAYVERRIGSNWTLIADFDGLAGLGPGYAIDLGLKAQYEINRQWALNAGWRILDGGADTRDTYNFARFHYWTAGLRYRF